jgi:hypothetical protein
MDCALKLRYAREGLRQQEREDFYSAETVSLVEELYWSCMGPYVDARAFDDRRLRIAVARAVAGARRTGATVLVRGPMLRLGGLAARVGVLGVHADRLLVCELCPRRMKEDPQQFLLGRHGAVSAAWLREATAVAVSLELMRRWAAASASAIGLEREVPVDAMLIGLRETAGAAAVEVPSRTIGDFWIPTDADEGVVFRNRPGSIREAHATFVHVQVGRFVDSSQLFDWTRLDRLRESVLSDQWPDVTQCIRARCKHCEFRVPGDPESGFARCWGPEVDHQRDHILELERLTDQQLLAAVARDGLQASMISVADQLGEPQRSTVRAMDSGVLQVNDELRAWARDRRGDDRGPGSAARDWPRGPAAFLEISGTSIPVAAWPGARPYELVPFQFAAHGLPSDASPLEDRIAVPGFVRCDLPDPRREFARALRDQLGDVGPVYHWSPYERHVVRSLVEWLSTSLVSPGDEGLLAFLRGLVGSDGRAGRLVELLPIARGFRPPEHGWSSHSLRNFVRYAWKYQRIAAAFQPGNGARFDPVTYADPIDPIRSLPTAEAREARASNRAAPRISATDPLASQRLWLECRVAGGRDPAATHELLRRWGHLQSASVLMAYAFLVHVAPVLADQSPDRSVRVFVSSTFKDFQEERNLLKRQVQPTLSRRSLDRFVEATVVDLRWGITSEQAGQGLTLPICLREIERCRPYFVGLLGHRYGWVPPAGAFPAALVERMPWLREHAGGSSITELEFRHGVFADARSDARFYFRANAYSAGRGADFESTDPVERQKLADLKQAIRGLGFRVTEDYPDPRAFADSVTDEIWERIDRMYPADLLGEAALPDWAAHRAHAARLFWAHVPDHDELREVRGMLADPRSGRVVIVGPSGSGKSALFANALRPYAESARATLVQHFVGVGSTPATAAETARRIIATAAARLGIAPDDARVHDPMSVGAIQALAAEAMATARGTRLIVAIDGVERIADVGEIAWLRAPVPAGAQLVLTAPTKRDLPPAEADRRRTRVIRVRPLSKARGRAMVEGVLAEDGRAITPAQLELIVAHRHAASPGFLRTLVDELISFPNHEGLPRRLEECRAARSLADLYRIVLRRVEAEVGRDAVRTILRVLCDAPVGMLEADLVQQAGGKHAEVSALRLQLGHALVDAGGRIALPPGDFARAVRRLLGKKQ